MKYRLEPMESFRTIGYVLHTTNEAMEGYRRIPAFWNDIMQNGLSSSLLSQMNRPPFGLLGINVYQVDGNDAKKFDYYISCSSAAPAPEGMVEYTVPAATWAVFPCKKEELAATEFQIVTEWQPSSGFELLNTGYESGEMRAKAPDLELYLPDGSAEAWVAVTKK